MIARLMPAALLLVLAAAAPADEPAKLPHVKRLSELLDVDVRDQKLCIALRKPDAARSGPLYVGSSDESWKLTIARHAAGASPATFHLESDERDADRWSPLHLVSITRDATGLKIYGIGRAKNTFVGVTFVQDAHGVSLLVQRVRRARARPLEDAAAASLAQLWHEHQPQLRDFLLPLLDEMADANVLRPRAGDVYRAFADIPADPVAVQKLQDLLPRLDSADATDRAAASAELDRLGAPAVLAALRIDASDLAPEQRARLDSLITRNTIWPDPLAARADPRFLVDCLDDADADVRNEASAALREVAGQEIEFDASAPLANRREAAGELLRSLDRREAQPAAARE